MLGAKLLVNIYMPYCKNTSLQLQLTGFMLGICVNVIIKGMYNVHSVYYPLNSSLVLANIVQLFFLTIQIFLKAIMNILIKHKAVIKYM